MPEQFIIKTSLGDITISLYDEAWKTLEELKHKYPAECPSLFSKTKVRRTNPVVADDKVKQMRNK